MGFLGHVVIVMDTFHRWSLWAFCYGCLRCSSWQLYNESNKLRSGDSVLFIIYDYSLFMHFLPPRIIFFALLVFFLCWHHPISELIPANINYLLVVRCSHIRPSVKNPQPPPLPPPLTPDRPDPHRNFVFDSFRFDFEIKSNGIA